MTPNEQAVDAKDKLLSRRAAISRSRTSKNDDVTALSSERRPEDLAENEEISEVLVLLSDRETAELREVDLALERLKLGTWGRCERCGDVIPENRMTALPTARRCAECASSS